MAAISTALIAAAVIGAGTSLYTANQQKKIAEEQQARLDEERKRQEKEAKRIAKDTAPEAEAAKAIKFGTGDQLTLGSTQDFLVPKTTKSQLGTTGSSGLGFNV